MPRFRRRFDVAGDPGYCAERFDAELGIHRLVAGRSVWFQDDSVRADLPNDSRRE